MVKQVYLFLIFFAYPLLVYSQDHNNKHGLNLLNDYNEISSQSSAFINHIYNTEVERESNYVNGAEYEFYFTPSFSSPLLFLSNGVPGVLCTKDEEYTDLRLIYDTYKDKLILFYQDKQNNNLTTYIDLNREFIDGFTLYYEKDTLNFRKISFTHSEMVDLTNGFYEIKYDAKSIFIIKHLSKVVYDNSKETYLYAPIRYIKVNDSFQIVQSKKDLFNLFGNRKSEIKAYYNQLGIKYRKITSDQLADILQHFDELNDSVNH